MYIQEQSSARDRDRKITLEYVAVNDVLPLKAARRDAIANWKSFWGPGTPAT